MKESNFLLRESKNSLIRNNFSGLTDIPPHQTSGVLTKLETQMDSGVAKLSMKDPSKPTIRGVREGRYKLIMRHSHLLIRSIICGYSAALSATSCDSSSLQDRWMKEAALMRKIQEKENHIRWLATSTCIIWCLAVTWINAVLITIYDSPH